MNFIYVIHLMCWNYLIAPIDLITHTADTETTETTAGTATIKGRARARNPWPGPLGYGPTVLTGCRGPWRDPWLDPRQAGCLRWLAGWPLPGGNAPEIRTLWPPILDIGYPVFLHQVRWCASMNRTLTSVSKMLSNNLHPS